MSPREKDMTTIQVRKYLAPGLSAIRREIVAAGGRGGMSAAVEHLLNTAEESPRKGWRELVDRAKLTALAELEADSVDVKARVALAGKILEIKRQMEAAETEALNDKFGDI